MHRLSPDQDCAQSCTGDRLNAPHLVLGSDGQPLVMEDGDVFKHFGRTFAIPGRRRTPKLYLPLHSIQATIDLIAPALTEFDSSLVIQTYRCGRREGIAQVTLGALLGIYQP